MTNGLRAALAALLLIPAHSAFAETRVIDREAFAPALPGRSSDFLAIDLGTSTRCELSESDLTTRHAPWSSFKIPNFLIALQTGAVESADDWRDWDPKRRPAAAYWPKEWRQGQTLQTAFRRSAVWYFRDVAEVVGGPVYRETLSAWNYGNAEAPDGDDGFWLGAPLAISVEEQVAFITALLDGEIDVAPAHLAALFAASEDGTTDDGILHGKTGSGPIQPGSGNRAFEGWYVGWIDRPEASPVVFTHYVRANAFSDLRTYRRDHSLMLLAACAF